MGHLLPRLAAAALFWAILWALCVRQLTGDLGGAQEGDKRGIWGLPAVVWDSSKGTAHFSEACFFISGMPSHPAVVRE